MLSSFGCCWLFSTNLTIEILNYNNRTCILVLTPTNLHQFGVCVQFLQEQKHYKRFSSEHSFNCFCLNASCCFLRFIRVETCNDYTLVCILLLLFYYSGKAICSYCNRLLSVYQLSKINVIYNKRYWFCVRVLLILAGEW